jgi:hypothetical protein
MDQNTKDMLDALDFIKERMATKDHLQQFATKDGVRAIVEEVLDEKLRAIHEPDRDQPSARYDRRALREPAARHQRDRRDPRAGAGDREAPWHEQEDRCVTMGDDINDRTSRKAKQRVRRRARMQARPNFRLEVATVTVRARGDRHLVPASGSPTG